MADSILRNQLEGLFSELEESIGDEEVGPVVLPPAARLAVRETVACGSLAEDFAIPVDRAASTPASWRDLLGSLRAKAPAPDIVPKMPWPGYLGHILLRRIAVPVALFLVGVCVGLLVDPLIRGEAGVVAAQPAATATLSEQMNVTAALPTVAPSPTFTPMPTSTLVPSATSLPTPTPSPTLEPTPTFTPLPVALVVPTPFPTLSPSQYLSAAASVSHTLPIPAPVQPVPVAGDAINIVVLGSDQRPDWSEWHTDAVHVVSIQPSQGTVSVLSIPRDLYVYIPGFGMSRINFADYYGEAYHYAGGGPGLVRDTLLYNLGIRMDRYVRTNFDGLIGIVDALGGVDIPVHCRLSDYWPYPDESGQYPILTIEPGIHHMDGETALWYARSRKTTSVFSRERRQQQVLQAIWRKVRSTNTLSHVPALWEQGRQFVATDIGFSEILSLAPLAFTMHDQSVRFYNIGRDEVTPWTTPYGGAVFLPRWETIQPIVAEVMAPVPEARLARTYNLVEVCNGTPNQDWDLLAADRVYRAGFPAVIGEAERHDYAQTQLIVYARQSKGTGVEYLKQMFGLSDDRVVYEPEGSSEYGFRLIIGADYQTCPEP